MTYDDLKETAEVFLTIDAELYKMLMSIIAKCRTLGVSASECLIMINNVLDAPTDKEVYTRDRVDGGFYIACKEMAGLRECVSELWQIIVWSTTGESKQECYELTDQATKYLN